MNLGKGKCGWPKRPDQTFVELHGSRPLHFGGPDTARVPRAEAENSQGAWARGRAGAGGRSQGPPPPRPSGRPPRPPRARRSRRPEEQEEEERSEPSPGALRDRVPGGGGGGSAPADSFRHFQPENGGPQEVILVKPIPDNVEQNSKHQQHRPGPENGAAVENGSLH